MYNFVKFAILNLYLPQWYYRSQNVLLHKTHPYKFLPYIP